MKTYLLVGNFGVGNLGDELLKKYFLETFSGVAWKVLSAHPKEGELPRLPGGFHSFFSFNWKQTLRALKECDGVVFGGGSLFTDVESSYACFLWWLHARAAAFYKKPTYFAFQGVGPCRTKLGSFFAKSALSRGVHHSVRDPRSMERLQLLVENKNIIQTFDPAFSFMQKPKKDFSGRKLFIVIPRKNSSGEFYDRIAELRKHEQFDEMRILSLQPEDPVEVTTCIRLKEKHSANTVIVEIRCLEDLLFHIGAATLVLSQRYHGALAALALSTPLEIVSQGKGDKLDALQALIAEGLADPALLLTQIKQGEDALRSAIMGS